MLPQASHHPPAHARSGVRLCETALREALKREAAAMGSGPMSITGLDANQWPRLIWELISSCLLPKESWASLQKPWRGCPQAVMPAAQQWCHSDRVLTPPDPEAP